MCSRRVAESAYAAAGAEICRWGVLSFCNSSITCSINRTPDRVRFEHKSEPERTEGEADDSSGHPGSPGGTGRAAAIPCPAGATIASFASSAAQARRRPIRYRGPGVVMSRASHRRRPITPATTVGLALLAALITVWLGVVAQFGGVIGTSGSSSPVPDRLTVIRVQSGETLQHLARRVAPDAPAGQVIDRIRELNRLESASLDAGQTLIAPVG